MKKHWIIISDRAVVRKDNWDTGRYLNSDAAKNAARELARENPGHCYEVYEALSIFVVDGLREEQAK